MVHFSLYVVLFALYAVLLALYVVLLALYAVLFTLYAVPSPCGAFFIMRMRLRFDGDLGKSFWKNERFKL